MIAASILFRLSDSIDIAMIDQLAKERAKSLYDGMSGLRTKAFVLNRETREYGGLYIWEDRDSLDSFLISDTFKASKDRFGTPEIKIFDLLALVEQNKFVVIA